MLSLHKQIAKSSLVDPLDIVPVKQSLFDLGYYEDEDSIEDFVDTPMFDGIEKYQRDNGLEVDGVMKPGGETETSINKDLKKLAERRQKQQEEEAEAKAKADGKPFPKALNGYVERQSLLTEHKPMEVPAFLQGDENYIYNVMKDVISGKIKSTRIEDNPKDATVTAEQKQPIDKSKDTQETSTVTDFSLDEAVNKLGDFVQDIMGIESDDDIQQTTELTESETEETEEAETDTEEVEPATEEPATEEPETESKLEPKTEPNLTVKAETTTEFDDTVQKESDKATQKAVKPTTQKITEAKEKQAKPDKAEQPKAEPVKDVKCTEDDDNAIQRAANWLGEPGVEATHTEPYIDSKVLLTVGKGKQVNSKDVFMTVNWLDLNGKPLSDSQKEYYFDELQKAKIKSKNKYNSDGKDIKYNVSVRAQREDSDLDIFKEITISKEEVDRLTLEHLRENLKTLRFKLGNKGIDWDKIPTPAKVALLDLEYSLGGGTFVEKKWPKLYGALKEQNYWIAADQCNKQHTNAKRNDYVKNLFEQAAKQMEGKK